MIERLKESLRHAWDFILMYYNSFLLCTASTWMGYTLFKAGHWVIGALLFSIVIIKVIGLVLRNHRLRQIGIIGLNIMWALNSYVFISYHQTIEFTWHISFFILLLGVGIALRGRFNE